MCIKEYLKEEALNKECPGCMRTLPTNAFPWDPAAQRRSKYCATCSSEVSTDVPEEVTITLVGLTQSVLSMAEQLQEILVCLRNTLNDESLGKHSIVGDGYVRCSIEASVEE